MQGLTLTWYMVEHRTGKQAGITTNCILPLLSGYWTTIFYQLFTQNHDLNLGDEKSNAIHQAENATNKSPLNGLLPAIQIWWWPLSLAEVHAVASLWLLSPPPRKWPEALQTSWLRNFLVNSQTFVEMPPNYSVDEDFFFLQCNAWTSSLFIEF